MPNCSRVTQGDATYLIVKNDGTLADYGLNAVCTHLGCVVPWNKRAGPRILPSLSLSRRQPTLERLALRRRAEAQSWVSAAVFASGSPAAGSRTTNTTPRHTTWVSRLAAAQGGEQVQVPVPRIAVQRRGQGGPRPGPAGARATPFLSDRYGAQRLDAAPLLRLAVALGLTRAKRVRFRWLAAFAAPSYAKHVVYQRVSRLQREL